MSKMAPIVVLIMALVLPVAVQARSTSANYILWGNALSGGSDQMNSTNYSTQASLGDISNIPLSSTNYSLSPGFEALTEEPAMVFSLSSNSVALSPNTLNSGAVSSASMTATVGTTGDFGYVLTVREVFPFQNGTGYVLSDVSDGAVSAGSEEFGVAVSGTDASFGDDEALTSTPLEIATNVTFGNDRVTTLTFKAGITPTTPPGTYSGTVVLVATGLY